MQNYSDFIRKGDIMKKSIVIVLMLAIVLSLGACGSKESKENSEVKVKSMGVEFKYDKAPEKAVVLGCDSAEIMVMLGLEDKIVAWARSDFSEKNIKKEYYEKIKDKKMLPDGNWPGVPTFETIIGTEPDFVYGTAYSFNEGSCGKVEDFTNEKINIYATEGTAIKNAEIDAVYHDIKNIGKIFRVEDKADKIIEELKSKVDDVDKKVKGKDFVNALILEGVSDGKIQVDGGTTFGSKFLERAGGKNIFGGVEDSFPMVSIEEVIKKNPTAIVVVDLPASSVTSSAKKQIEQLEKIAELKKVDAVKNKNYIIVPSIQVFPSAQSIEGLTKMAKGLHPDAF